MNTQCCDNIKDYTTLEYPTTFLDLQAYKPKATINAYKVYFDFETLKHKEHRPYIVRYETHDGDCLIYTSPITRDS